MKFFSLGVLLMLCVGLMIQNSHLHSQIAKANKTPAVAPIAKAKSKVTPKKEVKKTVVALQERPENYNQYTGTPPSHDPRCPSHLPYFDGRWGCVVKRP